MTKIFFESPSTNEQCDRFTFGVIEDLNELVNPTEKKGGKRYPTSKFAHLNDFTDRINAISVPYTGYPFTWKKKIHTHVVYERLNRAIVRNDWLNLYPAAIK